MDPLYLRDRRWSPEEWTSEEIEVHATKALKYFPSIEDPKEALKEYAKKYKIQGIFWTEGTKRYAWGPDVKNPVTKYWRKNTTVECIGRLGRKFEVLREPLSLKFINQPSFGDYRRLTIHTSQKRGRGWKLPTKDKHHSFKFPTEIILRILKLLLVAPKDAVIRPIAVTSNWKRTYTNPSFQFVEKARSREWELEEPFKFADTSRLISWTRQADDNGPYTLKREIILPILDAGVLRTCKILYELGSKLLNGYNQFDFNTIDPENEKAPPQRMYLMGKDYCPPYVKPTHDPYWLNHSPSKKECQEKINEGITQVSLQRPITMLEGYVYHDPFLRFLHAIGPKNASLIRNLAFTGIMHICVCSLHGFAYRKCADDLATSIEVYTPCIRKLCTGLQTLTLFPLEDEDQGPFVVPKQGLNNFEEAVSQLVQGPISKTNIDNVFVLEYVSQIKGGKNMPLEFAMTEWAKARKEIQQTQEEEGTARGPYTAGLGHIFDSQTRDSTCDFCGEDNHVWPDCHNLCRICGDYGHFDVLCPDYPRDW